MVNIQTSLEDFRQTMTSIVSYQQNAKMLAEIRRAQLSSYIRRESEDPDKEPETLSWQRMYYKHPITGEHDSYGFVKQNAHDQMLQVTLHENRQYQWLLSEAFEEYEAFLERVYLAACITEKSLWLQPGKVSLSLTELESKTDEWFCVQLETRKTKVSSDQIRKRFRARLPLFSALEIRNELGVNLCFYVSLIAQMRHQIVHTNGRVRELEAFARKTLEPIGLWNNGKPSNYREIIADLFFNPPYNTTIALKRRQLEGDHHLPLHTDVMQDCCRLLLSSADILVHALSARHAALGISAAISCSSNPGLP